MLFCPQCRKEYEVGNRLCPDCRVSLVRNLPPDPNQLALFEMIEIYKIPDEITGMALSSFLADAGVQVSVQPMEASFYGGTLNTLLGYWGKLLVSAEHETKARKQLEIFLKEFHGK
ncbi:MAG: hypothetical protein HGA76_05705 [Candidatus Firestonebacteria bacterium]|nr:hypothetical protein [Candidatus Firestonebacteria bacterium]